MILLLLLQIAIADPTFDRYLREAQEKLGLVPARSQASTGSLGIASGDAAWVPYGPGSRARVVYVRPEFLRQAHPLVHQVVAYHESCHLYLGTSRRFPSPAEVELQHLMIDGCVEWLLGPRHHAVMQSIPCGTWYPYEALRYNRRIRKERCR